MSIKLEVINHDLRTKEGWENYLAAYTEDMRRLHSKKEITTADVILFATVHPYTGIELEFPQGICMVTRIHGKTSKDVERCKDHFMTLVTAMSVTCRAIASIFTSEIWIRHQVIPTNDPAKVAESIQAATRVPVSQQSDRQDAVMIMASHREFDDRMSHAIVHPNGKTRTLDPWVHQGPEDGSTSGRFSSFVPSWESLHNPEVVAMCKEFLRRNESNMHRFNAAARGRA